MEVGDEMGQRGALLPFKGAGSGEDPAEPVGSGLHTQGFGLLDRTCGLNVRHFKVTLCGNLLQGGAFKQEKVLYLECGLQQGPWRVQLVGTVPGSPVMPVVWRDLIFQMLRGGFSFFFLMCTSHFSFVVY